MKRWQKREGCMANLYQFKVRLGVILIRDDKILLVRQNRRPFWVFPGGTLELGEGLEECAIREVREELNLDIGIEKILYLADFMREENGVLRQTVDVFVLADRITGTPVMTTDENLDEIGFFTLEDLKGLPVQPDVVARQLVKDWSQGFSGASGLYLGKYGPALLCG
jgi:ADP-ribose pyrophosphatase YjhB (NUDIX family)